MSFFSKDFIVIGGGAAGFFAALTAAQSRPGLSILILERTQQLLSKVKISGGGRCNVTHACFDPKELVRFYPRGGKALLSAFHRFGPADMVEWLAQRNVILKTEEDGRMFPITDNSQTIIDCLHGEALRCEIEIQRGITVNHIERGPDGFRVDEFSCQHLLLASGSSPAGHRLAAELGHTIVPPVPSLFTFNVPKSPLLDLAGISVERVEIGVGEFTQLGPLLLTHWGFSGPAALKLSAVAARHLHGCNYQENVWINWVPECNILDEILAQKRLHPSRTIGADPLFSLPRNLWRRLVTLAGIDAEERWNGIAHAALHRLAERLERDCYAIEGKTMYKQEFVTAGGVHLDEVDFRTMESRIVPGLFFAGEILDIDGMTGGFNFQNAWTTGAIAGSAILKK